MHGLSALAALMCDAGTDDDILALAVSLIASLGSFVAVAGYLLRDGVPNRRVGSPALPDDRAADAGIQALGGRDGAVDLPVGGWTWGFALQHGGCCGGYLLVHSATSPDRGDVREAVVLARQTAAVLAGADILRHEREQSARLHRMNVEKTAENTRLLASVTDLERHEAIHESLDRAEVSQGEPGIVRVLYETTGLAAVSEDCFGNLRVWAGPGRPQPYPEPDSGRRAEILRRAGSEWRPVRDRDRLIVPVKCAAQVMGVLALIDPQRSAGPLQASALELAAAALARELVHARTLAENELRLRGDLVEDLIRGTEDESAYARALAAGHDLHGPHQVVVVRWEAGVLGEEAMTAGVRQAAAAVKLDCLLGRRPGTVVLIVRAESLDEGLYQAVSAELGSPAGALGVGDRCTGPSDLPRSYQEALRALEVRRKSANPHGLTHFEQLGLYRVLAENHGDAETDRFLDQWLGVLRDYDTAHHTTLVATLSAYLDAGGGYDTAAAALQIHRSTLRYRLQRIREITGLDLADVDVRLNLHVATRMWRVLGTPD